MLLTDRYAGDGVYVGRERPIPIAGRGKWCASRYTVESGCVYISTGEWELVSEIFTSADDLVAHGFVRQEGGRDVADG